MQNGHNHVNNTTSGQTVTWSDLQQNQQQLPAVTHPPRQHPPPQQQLQQRYGNYQNPNHQYSNYPEPPKYHRRNAYHQQSFHSDQYNPQQDYYHRAKEVPLHSHQYPLEHTYHHMDQMKSNHYPGDLMYYPPHPRLQQQQIPFPDEGVRSYPSNPEPVIYRYNNSAKFYNNEFSYNNSQFNHQNPPVIQPRRPNPHYRRSLCLDQRQPGNWIVKLKVSTYSLGSQNVLCNN